MSFTITIQVHVIYNHTIPIELVYLHALHLYQYRSSVKSVADPGFEDSLGEITLLYSTPVPRPFAALLACLWV